jgi:hypothetical protein
MRGWVRAIGASQTVCTVYWQIDVSYTYYLVSRQIEETNHSRWYDQEGCADGEVDMEVAAITAHFANGELEKTTRSRDRATLPNFPSVNADQIIQDAGEAPEVVYIGRFVADFESGGYSVTCVRFRGFPPRGPIVQTSPNATERCGPG